MTKIGLFTAALAASTAIVAASAAGVKNINLLEGSASLYRKIPVYDQGGMGTCYAYAASQLIDYYRMSHGDEIRTSNDLSSTTWIAAAFAEKGFYARAGRLFGYDEDGHPLDAGFPGTAIRAIEESGVCTRGQVNSMTSSLRSELLRNGVSLDADQLVNVVQNLLEEYDELFLKAHNAFVAEKTFVDKGRARTSLPSITARPLFPTPVANSEPVKVTPAVQPVKPAPSFANLFPTVGIYQPIQADNTRVHRAYVPFEVLKSSSPDATQFKPLSEDELLRRQYGIARDNTYVAPSGAQLNSEINLVKDRAMSALVARYSRVFTVKDRAIQKIVAMALDHSDGLYGLFHDWFKSCKSVGKELNIGGVGRLVSPTNSFATFKYTIQKRLEAASPQPLSISYCSSILKSGAVTNLVDNTFDECGPHVSVLVGQRQVQGKVSYLLQNTWGTGCSGYSSKWECFPNQGALWVDGEILHASSVALHWIY